MSVVWMVLARAAFNALIMAIGKIPPERWAALGTMLVDFLEKVQNRLPAGHPAITVLNSYRAPASKLTPRGDK